MTLYHCQCNHYNWCRPIYKDSLEETLWICVNRKTPSVMVPGTEVLYCYWKIGLYLEIPRRRVDLFVPPEWRSISPATLDKWVGQLRDKPYQDIVLGGTPYKWLPYALVPLGQSFNDLPLPGHGGWPEINEEVPYWDEPRFQYSDGISLPIRINEYPPERIISGMEKIFCYWKIILPNWGPYKFELWVPPEWRGLTKEALVEWKMILRNKPDRDVTLGGVAYKWDGDTLHPKDQDRELVESQGYGVFNYHPPEDSDNEDETPSIYDGLPLGEVPFDPPCGAIRWEEAMGMNPEEFGIIPSWKDTEEIDEEKLAELCKALAVNQEIISDSLPADCERNKRRKIKPLPPHQDEPTTSEQ